MATLLSVTLWARSAVATTTKMLMMSCVALHRQQSGWSQCKQRGLVERAWLGGPLTSIWLIIVAEMWWKVLQQTQALHVRLPGGISKALLAHLLFLPRATHTYTSPIIRSVSQSDM